MQSASAAERKVLKAEQKADQEKVKQRAAFNAAISEQSEVDTVKEPKRFFNVDINLDNLKDELENIKSMIKGQGEKIIIIDEEGSRRATEL